MISDGSDDSEVSFESADFDFDSKANDEFWGDSSDEDSLPNI